MFGTTVRSAMAFGVSALVLSATAAEGAAADLAQAVSRETALVAFYGGGSPLSAAERNALDGAVRRTFAADPRAAQSASEDAGQVLVIIGRQKGANLAFAREQGREQIAFGGMHALGSGDEGRTAGRIVEAHDPVVVEDPVAKQLVTTQTVAALAEGVQQGAKLFSLPELATGDEKALAQSVRQGWPSMDAGIRDAVAHAERDLPWAAPYLARSDPGRRTAFLAEWRPKITSPSDLASRRLRLAEVMAYTGAAGFRNRAALTGGGGALRDARNLQTARDRAGRALTPGCGVAAGSVMSPERRSFCQPSPLP